MNNSKLSLYGFLNAAATVVYIALISLLLFNGNHIFGSGNSPLNIVALLCLLVLSASVVGTLLLGRPALWYFNGAKKEAIWLFLYSLIWLLAFTVIFLLLISTVFRGSL